jgi:hypothetical protein
MMPNRQHPILTETVFQARKKHYEMTLAGCRLTFVHRGLTIHRITGLMQKQRKAYII